MPATSRKFDPTMPTTLKTVTLGCKVNQYETEYVREGLLSIGYRDATDEQRADLCIVNTCTVTAEGDSKSRQVIRRLARENPQSRIVVMGCYATRAPEEVASLPNVTEVVTDKRELPDLLGRFGVVDIPTGISHFGNRHRAYVKVQDGCMLRCSYCIIPHVRPQLTSRPAEHILAEVARLAANGYREIVLTGVHLGHYGVEANWNKPKEEWRRLSHLVRAIAELPGDFRIRLSSIEATEVTRELIAVLAEFPERIAPHLHICLQSGSDAVLRRMRRRWGTRLFIDRCSLVREALDNPAITTDIIVGFPGETDEDFAATCQTARECGFSKIHIFPFSARKGTPAAAMADVVPATVKAERVNQLAAIEVELRDNYFRSLLGRQLRVIVEGESESAAGHLAGTSCRYAPVDFPAGDREPSALVDVVARELKNGRILATASPQTIGER
jgi:threonylcarbamoyladenosine tRNA methylthiotransferase MtaB